MPSLVGRVAGVYRRKGLRGVVAAARTRVTEQPYQAKAGMAERLEMLETVVPRETGSLLDIGCNIGVITAHFAQRGAWSVGLDIDRSLIDKARRQYRAVENCAFAVSDLTPENIGRLPVFEVVLLLSVHHNWMRSYGPDVSGEMLRTLVGRASKVLVFEAPARTMRYGRHAPNFIDNDEASVTAFNQSYLDEQVGPVCSHIVPLGKSPCWGEQSREPYRWSYALYP